MKLTDQINGIIEKAGMEAEELIRAAVRKRMTQRPYPGGFVFAMGSNFWIRKDGEVADGSLLNTSDIDEACTAYFDSFGTMTWRIDRKNGKLVETTEW